MVLFISILSSKHSKKSSQLADANEKFLPFTFIKNKYISNLDKTIRKPTTFFSDLSCEYDAFNTKYLGQDFLVLLA